MKNNNLIHQIDQNFNLHAHKVIAQTNTMHVYRSENITYVDSRLSCDTFNIIHIFNGDKCAERELQKAIEHFRIRDLDYCIWVNKENLSPCVKRALVSCSTTQQNKEIGMVLHLDDFQPPHKTSPQQVEIANTTSLIADYALVIAKNWTPMDKNILTYYEQTSAQYLDANNNISLLTYRYKNEIVSTIEMFPTDNEVIGLYGLATLETHRGLGIGSSLMAFALNKAKKEGFKKVILQASADGIGIYRKYGFKEQTTYFEYA